MITWEASKKLTCRTRTANYKSLQTGNLVASPGKQTVYTRNVHLGIHRSQLFGSCSSAYLPTIIQSETQAIAHSNLAQSEEM